MALTSIADILRDKDTDRMYVRVHTCASLDTDGCLFAAYIDEVENALQYIRETPEISNEEKKRFFKSANTNLGTSALCLSGGASFGYCTCDDFGEYIHYIRD